MGFRLSLVTGLSRRSRANGANGMSDIEGKVAREATSECGPRASFKADHVFAVDESAVVDHCINTSEHLRSLET